MLGNTVVLKHAQGVPQSALVLEQLFRDAGFPDDVYRNVFASNEQIAQIVIPAPTVQGVSLTGSERAGSAVVEDAYEQFVDAFAAAMDAVEPGDPTDRKTLLGPLSSVEARDGVAAQLEDAVAEGATVQAGGGTPDRPGAWLEATVLTGVTPQMRAFEEEIFGPVAVVHRVKDVGEAVQLANASPFGLGGSVFAADVDAAKQVAARIEFGMVLVNEVTGTAADLPLGGIQRSGVGQELGRFGIEEFANRKLIHTPKENQPDVQLEEVIAPRGGTAALPSALGSSGDRLPARSDSRGRSGGLP